MLSFSQILDAYASQFDFSAKPPLYIADLLEKDLQALDYDRGWNAIVEDFRRVEGYLGTVMGEESHNVRNDSSARCCC